MSHYVAVSQLPADGERLQVSRFTAWRSVLALVGGAGLIASVALLYFLGPDVANSFAYSYLFGFEVFFTITAGALFWLLLHNASNSSWGVAIRRIPEILVQAFLPLFFLSLPLFGLTFLGWRPEHLGYVWEWIGIHNHVQEAGTAASIRDGLAASHDTLLLYKKYPYLHLGFDSIVPGWNLRVVIYFAGLIWISSTLRGYSLEQDATAVVEPTLKARKFACGALPLYAVFSTFAAIDWIQSLNYKWFSTMFGVNVFAGSALASIALIILLAGTLIKTGHLKQVVTEEHFHIMGKLMHAFIIFWAYIAFSQFFLIWYAGIPEETQFYAIRNTGGWWYLSLGLTFLHFVLPFALLLTRNSKRRLNFVMGAAAFVIAVHILELYWMIIPERGGALYDYSSAPDAGTFARDIAFDLIALLTFAGIYGYLFLRNAARQSLYPCGDPRLEESVNLVS